MQGALVARKSKRVEPSDGPTPERLAHAQGAYEWGEGERGRKTLLTMRDGPIERALARRVISQKQYDAAIKFRHHYHRAGLNGSLQSMDMDRVFASDPGGHGAGWTRTDIAYFHRERYREAVQAMGNFGSIVVVMVVCAEAPLEEAGYKLNWGSRPSAIVAATERLRAALDDLIKHWGL